MSGGVLPQVLSMLLAVLLGVGGMFALFFLGEFIIRLFPDRITTNLRPWIFVGPTLVALGAYLVYPVLNTFWISFRDSRSENFVGLENYRFVFTNDDMLIAFRNNVLWLVLVVLLTVSLGLVIAVLTDRVKYESVAKSIVFLPMAISAVGAGVIWKFVYAFKPANQPQIGLLNAFAVPLNQVFSQEGTHAVLGIGRWVALLVGLSLLGIWFIMGSRRGPLQWLVPAGGASIALAVLLFVAYGLTTLEIPAGWLINKKVNNFALILVYVWTWVGFCMVILSAALKGIPTEILEAAAVDGATDWEVFWRITIPMVSTTIAVVATTMVINVLKVFDIVYVMTNGEFDTEVVANRMYKEMFNFTNFGRASAIAFVLLLAIIPVMIFNIRQFQQQEATR